MTRLLVLLVLCAATGGSARAESLAKAFADPRNYPAYVTNRTSAFESKVKKFQIDGKMPTGPMQCEHIKIHRGQADQVLAWEARDFHASNVYFHVHRAIDYFNWLASQAGNPIYSDTKPVVVRVKMDVDWMMWEKFSVLPRYNTAQTFPDVDPEKWGSPDEDRELWFFIPKRLYLPGYVLTRYVPWLKDTRLGTAGFPLDSALVPSVIYHEWTHLMTRPYLGLLQKEDLPETRIISEAYSDYFGSVIAGSPSMGESSEFSSFPYVHHFSGKIEAADPVVFQKPGPFIPNLFWTLRRKFGGTKFDVVAWKALAAFVAPEARKVSELRAALREAAKGTLSTDEVNDLDEILKFALSPARGRKGS